MNWTTYLTRAAVGLTLSVTLALTGIPFMDTLPKAEAAYSVSEANSIIATGNRYLGTTYQFGASYGQTNTFDCSSFTKWVYARNGIKLPRSSREQAKVGYHVSRSNLKKGDLVFFSTPHSNGRIAHVGIYAGNGKILHTYGEGGVKYSSLNSAWWSSHYITARRVIR